MRRVPSFGDACVAAPATTPRECPPLGKLTSMFTIPHQKEQLAFVMQIPAPSSCLYNGALLMLAAWLPQRPGEPKKEPVVLHKSHLTDDLLCASCVDVLEVCSPFLQSQLCRGSWPRCPTVRRQRCEGWLHSSPGSLSPGGAHGRWEHRTDRKGRLHCFILFFFWNNNFTLMFCRVKILIGCEYKSSFWKHVGHF